MESNILREDDSDGSRSPSRNFNIDGQKQPKNGRRKDKKVSGEGETDHRPAITGFQNCRVIGKSNTDKLFEERLKYHKAEIDAFLAKHSELRLER